jgi:hypothetical protein
MTDRVFSLSYGIPDELIVTEVPKKRRFMAPYLPGSQYTFRAGQEAEYYKMYRDSMFAMTQKKGGWDCLRHYEILANGCMPMFLGLEQCPTATLYGFPKDLVMGAVDRMGVWDEEGYEEYMGRVLTHVRSYASCSALAIRFLRVMGEKTGKKVRNVLMLCGHMGVNYSRELLWIGLKRMLDGGRVEAGETETVVQDEERAVEYPRLGFLYSDYPVERCGELYGKGFTYSRRIDARLKTSESEEGEKTDWTDSRIRQSILAREWDVVLYGKVGPDELEGGTMESMPFWGEVSGSYGANEIAFLYGGDECQDMTYGNRYSAHLLRHAGHGICFVREINTG